MQAAAALNFSAIAAINVSASVAATALLSTGLAANLQAALGVHAALAAPCPICDARALMGALGGAPAAGLRATAMAGV